MKQMGGETTETYQVLRHIKRGTSRRLTIRPCHVRLHKPAADEAEESGQGHGQRSNQEGAAQSPLVRQPSEDGRRNGVTQGMDGEDVDRESHGMDSRSGDVEDHCVEGSRVQKKEKFGKEYCPHAAGK
jgi:hypothetical protein